MIFSIYDPVTGEIICEGESARVRPDDEVLAHAPGRPGLEVIWSESGTPGEPARITSRVKKVKEVVLVERLDASGLPVLGETKEVEREVEVFGRMPLAELDPEPKE